MVRLIHFAHWAVLLFVLTAWLWPWPTAWWIHIVFVPAMILHWKTNKNRCFLSELEEKFKAPEAEVIEVEESQFIKLVWLKVLGRIPSNRTLELTNYGFVFAAWCLSVARIMTAARTS